mmetsp:Transcript_2186/g.5594  ORF Transcript_2186/g.5594 Transcript_2186/m.5594 type:complete len:93 (-) Transcript_2186:186-464(-)
MPTHYRFVHGTQYPETRRKLETLARKPATAPAIDPKFQRTLDLIAGPQTAAPEEIRVGQESRHGGGDDSGTVYNIAFGIRRGRGADPPPWRN